MLMALESLCTVHATWNVSVYNNRLSLVSQVSTLIAELSEGPTPLCPDLQSTEAYEFCACETPELFQQ